MNFFQSVRVCFSKYFTFKGRASRSEFWWFWLFYILFAAIPVRIFIAAQIEALAYIFMFIIVLFLIPFLAVGSRRLHDRNMSGWWQLIGIIPFGGIFLLIFWAGRGDAIANKYGDNPIADHVAEVFE